METRRLTCSFLNQIPASSKLTRSWPWGAGQEPLGEFMRCSEGAPAVHPPPQETQKGNMWHLWLCFQEEKTRKQNFIGKENATSSLRTLNACYGICHLKPFSVGLFLLFAYVDFRFYLVLSFWHYYARGFDCKQNVPETPLNLLLGRKSICG